MRAKNTFSFRFITSVMVIVLSVIGVSFSGSSITKGFVSIYESNYSPNDTIMWGSFPPLPFTAKYHVSRMWITNDSAIKTGYLFLAGGSINDTLSRQVIRIKVYPGTPSYATMPPLPVRLENAGGFILKDSLYIVGGDTSSASTVYTSLMFKLNLRNPVAWEVRAPYPIPVGEIGFSSVALNDTSAIVAGGMTGNGIALSYSYRYSSVSNTWSLATPVPKPLYGIGLAALTDSTLLLIGGRNVTNIDSSVYKGTISKSNPNNISWTYFGSYPKGKVFNLAIFGSKKKFAVMNGGARTLTLQDSPDTVNASTSIFDENDGTFTDGAIKPTPVTHTQTDGLIIFPPGKSITYQLYCYFPGGSTTVTGAGTNVFEYFYGQVITNLARIETNIPDKFILHQNYPNPFNPETKIKFEIPYNSNNPGFGSEVKLSVYDLNGKEVSVLFNGYLQSGIFEYSFNASKLSSGVYFYKLTSGSFSGTKKLILLK